MIGSSFVRIGSKPIITPDDLPIRANAVFNPGVAECGCEVILLLRIEDATGISQIRVARSANGVDGWKIADKPLLEPDLPGHPYEEWGCEDARVTKISETEWLIAYTAYSRYGPAVALAITSDFNEATRIGIVLSPTNKDATIFPRQFDCCWLMLHRPVTGEMEHIWYATSDRGFTNWSFPGIFMPERGGPWWDGMRIGCGSPPIETDEGWLLIYHGVKQILNHSVYRLGLALLDRDNPRKLQERSSQWIFAPETDYEQRGLAPTVVYTCGALLRDDEIWMYYGAADTVVGLAVSRVKNLLTFLHETDYLRHVGRDKGMAR